MITGKYVSAERIIEKVYRDYGFSDELEISDALEWIGDAIGLMGVNSMFVDNSCKIDVEDYRASLPDDLVSIELITRVINGKTLPMRYSGDMSGSNMHCKGSQNLNCLSKDTYRINQGYIFPSFETGVINITYESFPVDDRGFPLIQDDAAVIEGIGLYIAFKIAFKMFIGDRMKKAPFDLIRQEKDWYIGKAISRGKMPSLDQMESLKNQTLRLIPKVNAHRDQFGTIGAQEQKINHNRLNSNQGNTIF